ncbi:hypothetical protein D3C85_1602550 [compost metagenome]
MLALGEEATDEEVAAVQEDSALALADLDDEQWRAILVTKSETLVLDMAEDHPEALPVLLASILSRSKSQQARFLRSKKRASTVP